MISQYNIDEINKYVFSDDNNQIIKRLIKKPKKKKKQPAWWCYFNHWRKYNTIYSIVLT